MSPFATLFLVFVIVPALEVYLFVQVGGIIGAFWTGLSVVVTAVVGAWLLRWQGLATLARAQSNLQHGQLPALEMIEGVLLLIAGALLLTPGFFTDTIGFLLVVPGIRRLIAGRLAREAVTRGLHRGAGRASQSGPRVIDGEFERRDRGH